MDSLQIVVFCAAMFVISCKVIYGMHAERKVKQKLELEGHVVPCYIMMANKVLYDASLQGDNYAQIVFTLDNNAKTDFDDLQTSLQNICHELGSFRAAADGDKDEKILEEMMRTQQVYQRPLKVPSRISGQMNAYTAPVLVVRSALPGNKISHPWMYCRVAVGKDGSAEMVDVPRQ